MTLNNNNISSEKNLAPRQPGDDRGSTSLGSSRPRTGKENFRSRIPVRILPTGKGKAKADPKGPAPPNVKPQPIVSLDSYPESPELLEKDRWFLLDCRLLPPPPVPPTIEQNRRLDWAPKRFRTGYPSRFLGTPCPEQRAGGGTVNPIPADDSDEENFFCEKYRVSAYSDSPEPDISDANLRLPTPPPGDVNPFSLPVSHEEDEHPSNRASRVTSMYPPINPLRGRMLVQELEDEDDDGDEWQEESFVGRRRG